MKADRANLLRRLKAHTNEMYLTVEEKFDEVMRVYMQKFKEKEFPIIKNGFSYNLGVLPEYESFAYMNLLSNENSEVESEEKIEKELKEEKDKRNKEAMEYI